MARRLFLKHLLKKIFLEDWGLKLIALVITIAIWLGVTGLATPTTKRLTVPLNINIASSAQLISSSVEEVEVEISGDKRKIEQINRADLLASIDLTEVAPGDRVVPLTPDTVFVPLPQGVKLVEVQPSRIAVNLEAVDEKEVEVRAQTVGTLPAGLEIYSTTVAPTKIRVRGPASIVKILEYVQTERIDLANKREDFTAKQVAVTSPDPKAAVLNTFVDVTFHIGEKRIERAVTLPIAGTGEIATFTLYGPRSVLANILKDSIYVETTGDTPRVVLPTEWQDVEVRDLRIKSIGQNRER